MYILIPKYRQKIKVNNNKSAKDDTLVYVVYLVSKYKKHSKNVLWTKYIRLFGKYLRTNRQKDKEMIN